MVITFSYLIHKRIYVYVDDLIPKSLRQENHVHSFWIILRLYKIYVNPTKCIFGVTSIKASFTDF